MAEDPNAWQRIQNQPYDQFDTDAAILWAGGHVAAGNMYVFNPQYTVRRRVFTHAQSYPVAGTVTPYTFFNVPETRFVCDMPGGGNGLPKNTLFMLDGVGLEVVPFLSTAGALIATGLPGLAASVGPVATAGELTALYEDGLVNMVVGERNVIENVWGLKYFPIGAGVASGGAGVADPAAAAALAIVSNGPVDVMNRGWPIDPIVPILENKQVSLTVQFQAARAISIAAACTIKARLYGTYITRGTNF